MNVKMTNTEAVSLVQHDQATASTAMFGIRRQRRAKNIAPTVKHTVLSVCPELETYFELAMISGTFIDTIFFNLGHL